MFTYKIIDLDQDRVFPIQSRFNPEQLDELLAELKQRLGYSSWWECYHEDSWHLSSEI